MPIGISIPKASSIPSRSVQSWSNAVLLEEARVFLARNRESLVILPGRASAEGMAWLAPRMAGVHHLTFAQLASELARPVMAVQGLAPITALGMEAICARVIQRAKLSYFRPVVGFPGFSSALAKTLSELRLAGSTPLQIAAVGETGPDLALLLELFEEELEQRKLADLARILTLASTSAGEHRLARLPMLLMDAPLESEAHRELLQSLASRAERVLALVTSGEKEISELLNCSPEYKEDTTSPLDPLRRHLFEGSLETSAQTAAFEIFSAPGEGLEAVEIARRILKLARESVPFDDMAVLLRNPDRQQVLIEEAFRRARIPGYMSRGSARPDPGGRALLALLACAIEKCSASRFAEYLSLNQVPFKQPETEWTPPNDDLLLSPNPQPETEVDAPEAPSLRAPAGWERLLVDAAVIGGRDRWERRLKGLEQELELRLTELDDDEPARARIERQLEQLRELGNFALPLIGTLDQLPKTALWSEWIERLSELARLSLRRAEPVIAVLAEFEPMGETGPATLEEVANVLNDRLRFLRADPPRRRWGQVFVGSIEEARARVFHAVFLPGLAEGLFPQRALEDPLLLDPARENLGGGLELRTDKAHHERLRLRLAVAAARQKLVASYSRMDVAEARPRVPSFYALELPRAIDGKLPALADFEKHTREASPARLNWPAPDNPADAIDDAEYDLVMLDRAKKEQKSARYLIDSNAHLARSLRARWTRWKPKWVEADGLITSNAAVQEALSQHRLTARAWSASSLEQFSRCPYKFALHGILGLKPREEAAALEQLDPLTRGALFHEVQFSTLGEFKAAGLLPLKRDKLAQAIAICDQVLNRVAAKYEDKLAPAIPRVWRTEIEDLRTDLRGWLQHAAQNDDDWQPIHFEFGFGLELREGRDASSTADEAVLKEGVRLRGSIDLVERHVLAKTLRVTDHKTGKPPEQVPAYVGGGRYLQPILYALAAERLLGEKVEAGRLFYATQRGGYNHMLIPASDSARRFAGRLLENIDGAIASGFLPPAPEKDACGFCDYRLVCGPYEERRFAREKNRKDERLEPLIEIRGML